MMMDDRGLSTISIESDDLPQHKAIINAMHVFSEDNKLDDLNVFMQNQCPPDLPMTRGTNPRSPNFHDDAGFGSYSYFPSTGQMHNGMPRASNGMPSSSNLRGLPLNGSLLGNNGSLLNLNMGIHTNSIGSFSRIPTKQNNFSSMNDFTYNLGPSTGVHNDLSMLPKNGSMQDFMSMAYHPSSPRVSSTNLPSNISSNRLHKGSMAPTMGVHHDMTSYGSFIGNPPGMLDPFMNPSMNAMYPRSHDNSSISLPGLLDNSKRNGMIPEINTTSTGPPQHHHENYGIPHINSYESLHHINQHDHPVFEPTIPHESGWIASNQGQYMDHYQHQRPARSGQNWNPNQTERPQRGKKGHKFDHQSENAAPGGNKPLPHSLDEISDKLQNLCTDQIGSRKVQQAIQCEPRSQREANVQAVLDAIDLQVVCDDIFGNYVIQKCAECGSDAQRMAIITTLDKKVPLLSNQMCGCRVIQSIIDNADNETNALIFDLLHDHIIDMVESQNGNHVVQKAIQNMEEKIVTEIATLLAPDCIRYSKHGYGCRVMQRLLEKASKPPLIPIFESIMEHARDLIVDQYGNYVLQHIALHGRSIEKDQLSELVLKHFVYFSKQKFASNVVENCVNNIDTPAFHDGIMDMIFRLSKKKESQTGWNSDLLVELMMDKYANYVMQAVFRKLTNSEKVTFITIIHDRLKEVSESQYGKRIGQLITGSGLVVRD